MAQKFSSLKVQAEWAEFHPSHGIQAKISIQKN